MRMGLLVCNGALLTCSFGMAPTALIVPPVSGVLCGMPAANIMDMKPFVNIPTFGMCSSPANPVVIAATAAKLGVFTPMPCIPSPVSPWAPVAPNTLIGGLPALCTGSMTMCAWAGVISITSPGQVSTLA